MSWLERQQATRDREVAHILGQKYYRNKAQFKLLNGYLDVYYKHLNKVRENYGKYEAYLKKKGLL